MYIHFVWKLPFWYMPLQMKNVGLGFFFVWVGDLMGGKNRWKQVWKYLTLGSIKENGNKNPKQRRWGWRGPHNQSLLCDV